MLLISNSLEVVFQGHQVSGGTITNPGDMDAFKRQQAMAGRARIANSCLSGVALFPPCLLCFPFVFFSL